MKCKSIKQYQKILRNFIYKYVCLYVCLYECMYYVCVYVCMYACMYECMHVFMYVYMYIWIMHICMYVCIYVCMCISHIHLIKQYRVILYLGTADFTDDYCRNSKTFIAWVILLLFPYSGMIFTPSSLCFIPRYV